MKVYSTKTIRKIVSSCFLVTLLFLLSVDEEVQAIRAIPDDLIVAPVLITLNNDVETKGTGFYFRNTDDNIYLITAEHVFFSRNRKGEMTLKSKREEGVPLKAFLHSYPKSLDWKKPARFELNLEQLYKSGSLKHDSTNDVAAVKIRQPRSSSQNAFDFVEGISKLSDGRWLTVPFKGIKFYDDVLIGNDIYVSGFPASIGIKRINQIDYDRPLLRKGIVAGKNEERKTLTIDCPSYGGNSGGPVTELEKVSTGYKIRVIGIITQFVPYQEEWINRQHRLINVEYENSGYTIVAPMDSIIDLINEFSN